MTFEAWCSMVRLYRTFPAGAMRGPALHLPASPPDLGHRRKGEDLRPPNHPIPCPDPTVPSLLPSLREHVRARAENRPGVYRLYGPGEELLYVGKSVRVRSRLLSYFRAPRGEKAWEMIRETASVEWDYVPNEFGALVTEMRLIQRHRPKYNVQHKRKRAYAFVKVTREPAPRVLPTGRVVEDGATYFGPFPRVGRVAETVRDLAYVLGLRDCPGTTPIFFDDQLEIFGGGRGASDGARDRPPRCLRADLGTCLAPCCGRTSASTYRERVRQAVRFLEGRDAEPLRLLEARMADAVQALDFEYAATLRDRRDRLSRFQEELAAWRGRMESLTFVYRVPGYRGGDRLYLVRHGLVRGWTPHPKNPTARARAASRVREVYGGTGAGPVGLTPHEAAEILLVARWFRIHPREMERTEAPEAWLSRSPSPGPSGTPPPRPAAPRGGSCSPAPCPTGKAPP